MNTEQTKLIVGNWYMISYKWDRKNSGVVYENGEDFEIKQCKGIHGESGIFLTDKLGMMRIPPQNCGPVDAPKGFWATIFNL